MEILIAIYLVIGGTLFAAHKDGIIADDTVQRTVQFELRAARQKVELLSAIAKRNQWEDQ